MKNLVIKTALITLASIIGVALVVMGALMIFAPKTIANFFDNLGMDNAALTFYEKQYDKTEEISDLAIVIDKIDVDERPLDTEKYLLTMLSHNDYEAYLTETAKENFGSTEKAREFYYGKLVLSRVNLSKFSDALNDAYEFYTKHGGYTEGNPYRTILYTKGETLSDQYLKDLKSAIRYKTPQTLVEKDVAEIDKIIQERTDKGE